VTVPTKVNLLWIEHMSGGCPTPRGRGRLLAMVCSVVAGRAIGVAGKRCSGRVYSVSTRDRCRSLTISIRWCTHTAPYRPRVGEGVSPRRACRGVRSTSLPAAVNTVSNAAVNFASWSRKRTAARQCVGSNPSAGCGSAASPRCRWEASCPVGPHSWHRVAS